MKRLITTTVLGLLCGIWYHYTRLDGTAEGIMVTLPAMMNTVLSIGLLGFVIGISALRMQWALHGALMGAVVSLPITLPAAVGGNINLAAVVMLLYAFYGVLIELFVSVFFGLKQER